MADDDGSRRPSQPSTPVNPAGVGSSASNRHSPGMVFPRTIQEILQTGDPSLIDDAFEQWSAADMGRLLESIPTPPPITVSPVGVGSAASNLSPSPGLPRTPTGGVAGTGGGGSSSGSSPGSRSSASTGSRGRGSTPQGSRRGSTPQGPARASTPRGRPQQAQKQPRGRGRGRGQAQKRPRRPNPSPTLPWSRPGSSTQVSPRFATTIAYVVTRPRTNCSGTAHRQHHHHQQYGHQL